MTSTFKKISLGSAAILAGVLFSTAASAQATRTWVSGVGDDSNPCSRTAPCKTFAGAQTNTIAGGEINCLDSGGFGSVTITQALTIDCSAAEGGVLATAGANGITIAAGASDAVQLIGLDVFGAGSGGTGINVVSGGSLRIANTKISGFNSANYGINLSPTTSFSQVFIDNVTITNNGLGLAGGGILISPASNTTMTLAIRNSSIQNNFGIGIRLDISSRTSTGVFATISHAIVSSDNNGLLVKASAANGGVTALTITDSTFTRNGNAITVNTPYAPLIGNTTITDNNVGLLLVGTSKVTSFGNNNLGGNVTDGAFSTTLGTK